MLSYLGQKWHSDVAHTLYDFVKNEKGIIYVDFIRDVAPLAIALQELGLKTTGYHGDKMSYSDKEKICRNWRDGVVKVVVATKAFGMGVDQPDVDVIIRIGCPQNIEDMTQEFGRAGRDGRKARGT